MPLIQNWDCHSCSHCCRIEAVITDEEKRRIEALDLAGDPEVAAGPWFARVGPGAGRWRLNHRPEGGCVFLTAGNRCRIQERFGADAKPFVCRLFPFVLIPAGDQWRVGLRFSCPSAAANEGRPLAEAQADLVQLAQLLERHVGRSADSAPAPLLRPGQQVSWSDARRIVEVLVEMVQDRADPLERRIRKCLALARIGSKTHFDQIQGGRLTKYLQAVRRAVEADVPREAFDLPPPDRLLGGVLFRALLAIYARRDREMHRGWRVRGRLGRVLAGWRFVRGRGPVPRINEFLPETRFEEVDVLRGVPAEVEEALERYFVVKLNSLQFFGAPNLSLPFWSGLESLALTLPMIHWLRRAFSDRPPVEAVQRAIQIVDDHFGANPMLGFPHVQYLMRLLAQRGELDRLLAWHGR